MQTRAYAICRRCAAVFPTERRCPRCDGDAQAAQVIAAATEHAHAIEHAAAPARVARRGSLMSIAALIAFVMALGATVAAIASPGGAPTATPASGAGGAAHVGQ